MAMTLGEMTSRIARILATAGLSQGKALNEIIILANDAYRTVAMLSHGLTTSVTQSPGTAQGNAALADPTGQSLNKILFASQAGKLLVEVPEMLLLGGMTSFPYGVYAWNFSNSGSKKVYWAGVTSTATVITFVCEWIPKGITLSQDSDTTQLSTELDDALVAYLSFRVLSQELFRTTPDKVSQVRETLNAVVQDMQKYDFFKAWVFQANQTSNPNLIGLNGQPVE